MRMNEVRRSLMLCMCGALSLNAWAGEPRFQKHVIDGAFQNGYQVSAGDIDSDGRPDVIALSTTPSRLVWFRNPDWARFTITAQTERNIDVAPYDVDGDGDLDLALAYEFDLGDSSKGGKVCWLERPADPVAKQEWARHDIGAVPTSHRVRWADIEGGGRKTLLNLPIIGAGAKAPEYAGGLQFMAYRIPENPAGPWASAVIDASLEVAHGLAVVRWGADARDDILTASFGGVHLFQNVQGAGAPSKRQLGAGNRGPRPKQGSSEVGLGPARARWSPLHRHDRAMAWQ